MWILLFAAHEVAPANRTVTHVEILASRRWLHDMTVWAGNAMLAWKTQACIMITIGTSSLDCKLLPKFAVINFVVVLITVWTPSLDKTIQN